MKFSIKKKVIQQAVDFISNYIDNNDTNIFFRSIKFELDESELILTGSSTTMSARKILTVDEDNIKHEINGHFYVNAQNLKNIIKGMETEIQFTLRSDGVLEIQEDNDVFELSTVEIDLISNVVFADTKNRFKIKSKVFERIISNVAVSTSVGENAKNDSYKCIRIKNDENGYINFSATDTFRLSFEKLPIKTQENINIMVDVKNIKKLITKDAPEVVEVYHDNSVFGVVYENTIIQTNVKIGDSMNLEEIIQNIQFTNVIKIEKKELEKLINKVVFYVSDKVKKLEFDINNTEMKVQFEVPQIGRGEAVTNKFEYKQEPFLIDMNFAYLKEALSTFDSEIIYLKMNSDYSRVCIVSETEPNNIQLLTPIRRY
ncbi:DNA polymerase III subunit beta [Mycoplasma corogypsi]|uniref:DNA polymerase III subunit beta n=1 Tax=Mycoplasma corogypsi TaxID=2106 RepID=UPI0038730E4C